MKNNSKPVLIVEQSQHLLESKKSQDNSYILEGIFAEFGVKNNNNRIYEAEEYIPHLEYLKEKIREDRLVGELDHPEKFDVSLKNVSHIIENLEYDEKTATVRGRIRLLDTEPGQHAQKLIDGGVKLSISSRAAGLVESNNTVKIKKIFTYDLVADPGFASARLNRINESLGIDSQNISIYEISDDLLKSTQNFDMSTIYEYENEEISKKDIYSKENTKNGKQMENQNFVTVDELNKYSMSLKKDFQAIEEKINNINTNNSITESEDSLRIEMAGLTSKFEQLVKYMEHIAENVNTNESKLDNVVSYTNYLSEQVGNTISYAEAISENLSTDIAEFKRYANYLAEKLDESIEHSNYLAENIDNAIKYSEHLAEHTENISRYAEYLGEGLNNSINHTNHIVENVNNVIGYAEHISEGLGRSIEYSEHLAENMEDVIEYSEYIREGVENSIGYTEFVAEQTLTRLPMDSRTEKVGAVQESIDTKFDKLFSLIEKQKINEPIYSAGTPKYLSMLSESAKNRFYSLSTIEKQKVVRALNENVYSDESEILDIWSKALLPVQESRVWITNMPEQYREVWESLDESRKAKIEASARYYDMSSQYKINTFWHYQGLNETASQDVQKTQMLVESVKSSETFKKISERQTGLGYNQDTIKNILKK